MSTKKITIKEMKHDRFREAVFRAYDRSLAFAEDNWKPLALAAGAVVAIVMLAGFWVSWSRGRAEDAQAALAAALEKLPPTLRRSAAGDDSAGDLEGAASELSAVNQKYRRYDGGRVALYYLALVQLEQGEGAVARQSADSFLSAGAEHDLAPLARWIRARAFAREGNPDEAVAAYRDLIDNPGTLLPAELGRLYLAEYLENLGRLGEALEEYRTLSAAEADGPWKQAATRKVEQIEPLVAGETAPPGA